MTTRAEVIKQELEKLKNKNGRITPAIVVKAAKSPKSPLHSEFVWDDVKAAQLQRLGRARELIQVFITVTVVQRDHIIKVPVFVRDPSAGPKQQGYVAITHEGLEREEAHSIMLRELSRCESSIERARGVVAVLNQRFPGLSAELENLLSSVLGLRSRLEAAE